MKKPKVEPGEPEVSWVASDIVLLLAAIARPAPRPRYRVGGLIVESDVAIEALAPFALERHEDAQEVRISTRPPVGTQRIFQGEIWIGGEMRPLECEANSQQTRLRVPGLDDLVLYRGRPTFVRRIGPSRGDDVAIGPGLLYAMAEHGVFALHASAALSPDGVGVVAFLGPSGCGKSTLAQAFGAARVADDILPIGWELGGVETYPHYPQLKLEPGAQWDVSRPSKLRLRALFVLEPKAPEAAPRATRLTPTAAVVALVRNTVAARLFSGELLDRHLSACADFALNLPAYALEVPHALARLPEVKALVESELG